MSKKPVTRPNKGFFRNLLAAALLAIASASAGPDARAQPERGSTPGDFDYYVLALSWSPTYCGGQAENDGGRGFYGGRYGGRNGGDAQCSGTRPYAFVLHGLWPQYERKGWPEYCELSRKPWVSGETIDSMLDIMPSRRLVIQEYKKHGVCSGLDPHQYFGAARQAYQSIRIPERFQDLQERLTVSPEDVRKAFLDANRQFTPDMIQIACSRNLLREVRICFAKDLAPRPCSRSEQNRRLCTYDSVTMPPVRGGGTGPHGGPSGRRGDSL